MARLNYQIDPNPDTGIISKNPNASFASWSLDEGGEEIAAQFAVNEPATEPADEEETAAITNSKTLPRSADHCTEEGEIRYAVSRRHLISASPMFEGTFSKDWNEGIRDENDGIYTVTTLFWDGEVLLHIFLIIHHRDPAR